MQQTHVQQRRVVVVMVVVIVVQCGYREDNGSARCAQNVWANLGIYALRDVEWHKELS